MSTSENPHKISEEIEKLREEISKLSVDIDESYYRIPKEEFENITVKNISQDISDQSNKRISVMRNWILFVLVILSFLGYKTIPSFFTEFSEDLKQNIDKRFKKQLSDYKSEIEKKFDDEAGERVLVTKKMMLATDIRLLKNNIDNLRLKNNIDSLRRGYEHGITEIKKRLDEVIETKDKKLISDYLGNLFSWTFASNQWADMNKLAVKYENICDFTARMWADIAIADMALYEEMYTPYYKERAIDASAKALKKLPDYGTPHAVRLIINMIDYKRKSDENEKEAAKNKAFKLIEQIKGARRAITAKETYDYLERIRTDKYLKEFIDMLFELLPEPMEQMKLKKLEYETYVKSLKARKN